MAHFINKTVFTEDLGTIGYKEAWEYQEKVFQQIVDKKVQNRELPNSEQTATENYMLFCQHPHVYTLGKSGKKEHLLINNEGLSTNKADYFEINRGGDITYHGPGQLVVYPILDLDNFFTDIHKYLRYLEEAVIQTLAFYGIGAGRIEGLTGVWVAIDSPNPRKICAMGVRASRWVTMHGLALNVNTDLSYFNHIVPCGINDKAVTSLAGELGHEVDFKEVQALLLKNIAAVFDMQLVDKPSSIEAGLGA